jgi:hypothetical protein
MATAYTPILKLALPVTGELNGTWGTVVNDNITSMVEQAVAGLATINTWAGNSHTLTTADGTTSESRCAMLVIDDDGAGQPAGAATVICPAATKAYIVQNLCGQTVTVKTSAGTGVAIPNNQSALVFCNGTNVVTGAFNGDVVGPASATDNAIVRYDGATGKLIQNSGVTIDDSNNVSGVVQLNATTVDTTNIEVTNLKAKDGTAAGSIADSTGIVTLASTVLTTTDINGGTIDATTVGATTPSTVVATQVDITAQGDLRLQDSTGGEYVALQAPATIATSYTLTLPVDDGTSGQALITDGSGVLSWSSAASGDVYGPASATDNAIARYDGTTGKIIQNSAVTIADDGATVIAANSSSDGLRITQIGTGNALLVEDSANPDATPFVVTAAGKVGVNVASPSIFGDSGIQMQSESSTGAVSLYLRRAEDSGGAASVISFDKLRGTFATPTSAQNGDNLGYISFRGYDGAGNISAATITASVDGTPGTNDMPGRLVFSTTADGASSPTERMRIDSAGRVGIGSSSLAGFGVRQSNQISGNSFSRAYLIDSTNAADVSNTFIGFGTALPTANAVSNLQHFSAGQGTLTGAVTNQFGFNVASSLTGATNNYGFYGNIASGTGRWNFYAAGTAANYFEGNVGIGVNAPVSKLDVYAASGYVDARVRSGSNQTYVATDGSASYFGTYSNIPVILSTNNVNRGGISAAGVWSLGAPPGAESLRVTPVASAVNYLEVQGAAAGGSVSALATGSDTNVGFDLYTKGGGGFVFYTNSASRANQFVVAHTASAVNYFQVTGAASEFPVLSVQGSSTNISPVIKSKGSGAIYSQTGGGTQFIVDNTASAVNWLQVTGAATGVAGPTLSARGSDTNIPLLYLAKGNGNHQFSTNNTGNLQLLVYDTASAVNSVQITGAATGGAPLVTVGGADTNIDLRLAPKGTGNVRFGTLTATSDVAITGFIEIKDGAGNVRKLAVIT